MNFIFNFIEMTKIKKPVLLISTHPMTCFNMEYALPNLGTHFIYYHPSPASYSTTSSYRHSPDSHPISPVRPLQQVFNRCFHKCMNPQKVSNGRIMDRFTYRVVLITPDPCYIVQYGTHASLVKCSV